MLDGDSAMIPKRSPSIIARKMPHSAMPITGRSPAASRTACRPGSLKQASTKASALSRDTRLTRGMTTLSASRCELMPGGPSASPTTLISGPPDIRSGATASSIAVVTDAEELGLMTRMRRRVMARSAVSGFVAQEVFRDLLAGRDPHVRAGFRIGQEFAQQTQPHRTAAALRMQHGRHHRAPISGFVEFVLPDREHVLLGEDRAGAEPRGQP